MRHKAAMQASPTQSSRRIFLVSFNKCGTGSFQRLFARSQIATVHHHLPGDTGIRNDPTTSVALILFKNFMLARDPLTGIDGYAAYTDLAFYADGMFHEAGRLYPYLHLHYPDSYFILATRDREAWVQSRLNHGGGSLADRAASALGLSSHDAVADLWRQQFVAHNAEVRSYFAARPEARFLEYDLDADEPQQIADFLAEDFRINVAAWGRSNVTRDETRQRAAKRREAAGR
jgi:hypothetical protein